MKKILLMVTIILCVVVCSCGSVPQEQTVTVKWEDSIQNPDNQEFIDEVAFNESVASSSVTQQMFDQRYSGY